MIFSQRVRWPDVHLLKQVKRIYLDSFDKMDRVPFFLLILGILIGKLKLIAAFRRQLAGFGLWFRLPVPASGTAYLAYLAVDEQQRCLGIGGELFQAVVAEAVENANKTLVWEVEIPEGDSDSPCRRRVVFYARQGGKIAECASRYSEKTQIGTMKPIRIMWRPLTDPLQVEKREEVIRWIQAIYHVAYRKRYSEAEVEHLFMEQGTTSM